MQAQEAVDLEPWAGGQVGPDCRLSARMWYDKYDYHSHAYHVFDISRLGMHPLLTSKSDSSSVYGTILVQLCVSSFFIF